MTRWLPFALIAAFQAGDMLSTWIGLNHVLAEIDGLHPLWLCAGKLVLLAVCWILTQERKFSWIVCIAINAVTAPVVEHNVWLIFQATA